MLWEIRRNKISTAGSNETESGSRLFASRPNTFLKLPADDTWFKLWKKKLIIAYGSCQIISPFYILRSPRVPLGKPSHTSSGVSEQAADAKSAAAATHKRVYLAEERRRRLCRPIFTVTPSTVRDCDCNSLNTWMGGGGGEGFMGKNCSFISWLLSNSQPSPRASDY